MTHAASRLRHPLALLLLGLLLLVDTLGRRLLPDRTPFSPTP